MNFRGSTPLARGPSATIYAGERGGFFSPAFLPFVLNDEVISAPVIQGPIFPGGSGISFTGSSRSRNRTQLAVLLRAAALAGRDDLSRGTHRFGPELGQDSIEAGVPSPRSFAFRGGCSSSCGLRLRALRALRKHCPHHQHRPLFGLLSLIGRRSPAGHRGIVLTVRHWRSTPTCWCSTHPRELKTAKGPARAIELGYENAAFGDHRRQHHHLHDRGHSLTMGSGPVRGFSRHPGTRGSSPSRLTAIFVTRLLVVMWGSSAPSEDDRGFEMRLKLRPHSDELELLFPARSSGSASPGPDGARLRELPRPGA